MARALLGRYLDFYNRLRPHSSLDRRTPDEAYFYPAPFMAAAKVFRRQALDATTVGLSPSLRHTQHPASSNERNPAERHLSFAGNCSDNRSQRSARRRLATSRGRL